MKEYGFIRVGACVPKIKVADVEFNKNEIITQIKEAKNKNVQILTFPELSLTGYTCNDLFMQDVLLDSSLKALKEIKDFTKKIDQVIIIGMPLRHENQIFNVAVVIQKGEVLGIVPKTYIPNYSEFYEKRWFSSSTNIKENKINLFGKDIPFTTNITFADKDDKDVCFAIEICEDLWSVYPPSTNHAINGATIIFNLSSSNEIVGKYEYRKSLVKNQSAKTISAYVYASSGVCESSSDVVFSGHAMIAENGGILKENERFNFESNLIYTDVDVKKLMNNRYKDIS